MSQDALVSVIIPTYNSGDLLNISVKSVLEQTYTNFELLLVDDQSTDQHTLDLLHSFANQDPRIRLIFNQQNMGTSQSRNHAITLAQGKYVTFLDHDDNFRPNFLEHVVAANEQNHTALALCHVEAYKNPGTKAQCVKDGTYIPAHWLSLAQPGVEGTYVMQRDTFLNDPSFLFMPILPHGKLINLEEFRQAKLQFKDIYGYEDMDWSLRLFCHMPAFSLVPIVGVDRVVCDQSVSHFVNDRLIQGMTGAIQARYEVVKDNGLLPKQRMFHLLQSLAMISSRTATQTDPKIIKQMRQQGYGALMSQGFSLDEICAALPMLKRA